MKFLWEALLGLGEYCKQLEAKVDFLCFSGGDHPHYKANDSTQFASREDAIFVYWDEMLGKDLPDTGIKVRIKDRFLAEIENGAVLSREEEELLKYYLPYCLLPLEAKVHQRCIAISHFAQSLDGKIATLQGDSKWIGNSDNLIHAHRMRAICDGIMIGNGTLVSDQPSLTVRMVSGRNPRRIVIGSEPKAFDSLFDSAAEHILWIGQDLPSAQHPLIDFLCIPSDNGHISCHTILSALFNKGIFTVYIEGGSQTTSFFLKEKAIDIFQLHLSPRIFGSGISSAVLPEIEMVKESMEFEPFSFLPVGDTLMFVGEIK